MSTSFQESHMYAAGFILGFPILSQDCPQKFGIATEAKEYLPTPFSEIPGNPLFSDSL